MSDAPQQAAPGQPLPPPSLATRAQPLDGVSLAAIICGALLCIPPVAIVLGFIGIARTRGGLRSGRGLAIGGLVLGIATMVAGVAAAVALWKTFDHVAWEDAARPGDCVNVTHLFGEVDLWTAACDRPHDAEILASGMYDAESAAAGKALDSSAFCSEYGGLGPDLHIPDGYELDLSNDSYAEAHPVEGDFWACFLQREDGEKFRGSPFTNRDEA